MTRTKIASVPLARKKTPELPYILEPLRKFAVPIEQLSVDPKNARKHDDRNLDAIVRSLQKFGQRIPLVVQRQGMMVRAGNGRLMAAQKLGWTHVAAVVVDESETEAVAFAIADNRSGELAEWDYQNLSELVQYLAKFDNFNPNDIGYRDYEIEPLLKASWQPPEQVDDPFTPKAKEHHHVALSKEQASIVLKAVDLVRKRKGDDAMSEAEALVQICREYMG